MVLSYFNSIKVRLKLSVPDFPYISFEFQFHKGTIKTSLPDFPYTSFDGFQFHKGTIKTLSCLKALSHFLHFNSIKVRLKQGIGSLVSPIAQIFQFHKGTIKTRFIRFY